MTNKDKRTRFSFKSQLEFINAQIKEEQAINDEDSELNIVMFQSLHNSVNSAYQTWLNNRDTFHKE